MAICVQIPARNALQQNSCKSVLSVFKKMYSDARSVSPTKFHFSTAK